MENPKKPETNFLDDLKKLWNAPSLFDKAMTFVGEQFHNLNNAIFEVRDRLPRPIPDAIKANSTYTIRSFLIDPISTKRIELSSSIIQINILDSSWEFSFKFENDNTWHYASNQDFVSQIIEISSSYIDFKNSSSDSLEVVIYEYFNLKCLTEKIPFRYYVGGGSGAWVHLPATTDSFGRVYVNVNSLPALPAGTNNIGDVDILSLPSLPVGSNAIGTVGITSLPALPTGSNTIGSINILTNKTLKSAIINHNTSGDNTIISAVGSKKITVYAMVFSCVGTVNVTFKDGASTSLTGDMNFQTREGLTIGITPPAYLLQGSTNTNFVMNLSGAVYVKGFISYWEE